MALGSLTEELKALGNAVVPQVSEWIGRQIIAADREMRRELAA
jgi:site-specific DNA-cytosine methylase